MSTLLIPVTLPSAREDAKQLHAAFKGLGCDQSAIINILAHRDSAQLESIQQEYESKFSHELKKRLASELHGHFKKLAVLWVEDPVSRDALMLKEALKGTISTDHKGSTDIICSRTPCQLRQLKQAYYSIFQIQLMQDIEKEAHGDHKKLLLAFVNTTRYEGPEIQTKMIEDDCKAINTAGETKSAAEKVFIPIFTDRSRAHLAALISAYKNMFGKPLEKVLRKAMRGLGTDDSTLIWIVATRTELDMHHIKVEYKKKYGKTLNDAIHSETSGHYRTFLLSLIGPNY
ncbi:hypothetical protein LWI28_012524 [Acer negundo]|uniref:Annexin n=1 Tax=Acer negundo TaxID=4023 RepID=A0AAD5IMA6_ACENE|nr:hypothetical protein LWI28_012524 [Acer negundo]